MFYRSIRNVNTDRRFDASRSRWRYIWSPLAIIDLLTVLPFWIPTIVPSVFIVLRFLRIARLWRYVKRYQAVLDNIFAVLREQKKEIKVSLVIVGSVMMVASLLMYAVEHDAQPDKFRNAFSGFWWAVSTITTLGYGDIYPVTLWGRLLGAVITLAGVAAIAIPTAIINSGFVRKSLSAADIEKILSKKDAEQDRELEDQKRKMQSLSRKVDVRFNNMEKMLEEQRKMIEHLANLVAGVVANDDRRTAQELAARQKSERTASRFSLSSWFKKG